MIYKRAYLHFIACSIEPKFYNKIVVDDTRVTSYGAIQAGIIISQRVLELIVMQLSSIDFAVKHWPIDIIRNKEELRSRQC